MIINPVEYIRGPFTTKDTPRQLLSAEVLRSRFGGLRRTENPEILDSIELFRDVVGIEVYERKLQLLNSTFISSTALTQRLREKLCPNGDGSMSLGTRTLDFHCHKGGTKIHWIEGRFCESDRPCSNWTLKAGMTYTICYILYT